MRLRDWLCWSVAGFLCAGIALFSARYLLQIGSVPSEIAANAFANPWLLIHVAGAVTALLVGPLQFLPAIRARFAWLHRWLGRIYVTGCLVGGVAGFVLALGATSGPVSTAGFGTLAVLWLGTTSLAWRAALQRRFVDHRAWMVRSFALAFAAVTLRLYLPLVDVFALPFDDAYRAISFLSWVPNLLAAELFLRAGRRRAALA